MEDVSGARPGSEPSPSQLASAQPEQEGGLIGGGSSYTAEFYLYSFKIVPCTASYAHNWSLCPFVHPNEKARRRDPRHVEYEPLPCPFDKKGANCPYGDACTYTHNVYEYWLHPKRFRTQMCQQGAACKRPLCFFAHNLQELRFADAQNDYLKAPQQDATTAAAAAAALPGQPYAARQQQQQQQQASFQQLPAMVGGSPGMYVPAMPPYAAAQGVGGTGVVPGVPAMPGLVPAAGYGSPRPLSSPMQVQQQWLPGYVSAQGYVLLQSPQAQYSPQMLPGPPLMYFSALPGMGGMDAASQQRAAYQQQQQQQHYHGQQQQQHPQQARQQQHSSPSVAAGAALAANRAGQAWAAQQGAAAAAAAAAAGAQVGAQQLGGPGGAGGLDLMPIQSYDATAAAAAAAATACISPQAQYQALSGEQLLLSQAGSASLLQQHAQQSQEGLVAAAAAGLAAPVSDAGLSGSAYSWSLPPLPAGATTTTTSASMSLSGLSMPTGAVSASNSVPGSSNSSLSHTRPGAQGGGAAVAAAAAVTGLDALHTSMHRMSLRDSSSSQVRDL